MRKKSISESCFFIITLLVSSAYSNIKPAAVFCDHMVLQQKSNVPIWGWSSPDEKITVQPNWLQENASVTADKQGNWKLEIKTPQAGGPYTIKISGQNEIILSDVLIGEVWVCSGQSNMEVSLDWLGTEISKKDIKEANNQQIRIYDIKDRFSFYEEKDFTGSWNTWLPATSDNIRWFSAVGYYFGKRLQEELNVPIGLISSHWGGTPAESWMDIDTIKKFQRLEKPAEIISDARNGNKNPDVFNQNSPTALFNAMIAPLIPYKIAGVIWYQGEGNVGFPIEYRKLFPAMIEDWRSRWGQGDFPFYYVQIAPWDYGDNTCSQALREAQTMALSLPNTGMAVTMDIGKENDIHPRNKHDVGGRLALWALNKTYGKSDVVFSGPLYKKMEIENSSIRLFFDYSQGGLVAKGGELTDFTIAGENRKFVPAKAVIDGETVVVSSPQIKKPVAVRLAWRNYAKPNLFNTALLPASSFRTDDWPL